MARSNPLFCHSGLWRAVTALGLGIGCFDELSAGFNDVCTFIARNLAVSYVDRYDDKFPKEALGMFRSGIRRVWGHAAIFRPERPHLGPEPQARWPAVARRLRHHQAGGDSGPTVTSRTTTSSTLSPWTPDAVFTPVRSGRTGTSTSGVRV